METQFIGKLTGLVALGAVVAGLADAPQASAQTASPAAGCFVAPARMSDADVRAFLASPQALLVQFASGGLPLSNQVRALVGSSADTLAPILSLAASANAAQSAAIGAGLGRAARACAATNPEYAALIQETVAASDNTALETAFLAGGNETQTAALGAAGGGSPVSLGGGASAIGGGGAPGGGANGSAGGTSATGAGTSSFSAGGGGSYFSNSDDDDAVSVSRSRP